MNMSNGVTGGVFATLADLQASKPRVDTRVGLLSSRSFEVSDTPKTVNKALSNGLYANQIVKVYYVDEYGAVGDGVVNDTASFTDAFVDAALTGGTVECSSDKVYKVDSFTIPKRCGLRGSLVYSDPRTSAELNDLSCLLRLTAGSTITMLEATAIEKLNILPDGMVFPQEPANIASWTGTAINIGANAHGCYIDKLTVVGFSIAIDSDDTSNTEQIRCFNLNIDCLNGIRVRNVFDIAYIDNCHCWPVASINASVPDLERPGIAYSFSDGGDWNKITNSFSYGYSRGLSIVDSNDTTVIGCGFDNTGSLAGSIGIEIDGASNRTKLIATQAAAQSTGVRVNVTANNIVHFDNASQWGNSGHSILIDSGDVQISGNESQDATRGLTINSVSSRVTVSGGSNFTSHATADIDNLAGSGKVHIAQDTVFTDAAYGTNPTNGVILPTVASAATISLPVNNHQLLISGTTNIDNLNGGWAGREITLIFSGILTVGIGGNIKMDAAIVTTANTSLRFIFDGADWRNI